LARFVVLPLVALRLILAAGRRLGHKPPQELTNWPEDKVLLAHAAVAVAYTTVWDNYLVASGIWGYDRKLVSGVKLGWVPIEEYTFFVLQPLLTGSLLQTLMRYLPADPPTEDTMPRQRAVVTGGLAAAWLASLYGLWKGGPRRRYLSLITGWALPPIMLQTAFGGDILWRHRRLIAAALIPASVYLGVADSKAIRAGTWHISDKKTVGLNVIPHLPLEEALFFVLTNVLLIFGVTLVLSKESEKRLPQFLRAGYERFKARYIDNTTPQGPPTDA
jgi:lycopene cyclase domain-containing protein